MRSAQRRGFTLIELLVVVAIIAMLLSILLPSLSGARESAKAVVCGQTMRNFGTGLATYLTEYSDWIPGINTTGVAVSRLGNTAPPEAYAQSKLPVQTYDWITPIVAYTTELPSSRAERFKFLLDKFKCASQRYTYAAYTGSDPPDSESFIEMGQFPSISYLSPAYFHWWGQKQKNTVLGTQDDGTAIKAFVPPSGWEVKVDDYVSKIDRVGSTARKIFAADGTRYLDTTNGFNFDFDHAPVPTWFGSFTDSSAWYAGSVAWGVKSASTDWDGEMAWAGSVSEGRNLALSYRHRGSSKEGPETVHDNKGTMNAVFYDGHVDRLNDKQSRPVDLWHPKGTKVVDRHKGLMNAPDYVP